MTLRHALVRREGRSSGTMSIQSGLRKLGELADLVTRGLVLVRPKVSVPRPSTGTPCVSSTSADDQEDGIACTVARRPIL